MGVTVRQPVHHETQRRCSTEEVSFVVKPYVAQYLWLVTVFVIFCVPTFFVFYFGVCQCCKYAFFYVCWSCVYQCFLLSDHQIFVCFSLCWRTDKNKQKKKVALILIPLARPPPLPHVESPPTPRSWTPPTTTTTSRARRLLTKTINFALSWPHFLDFLHFLHQQTFDIPLIVFSMHQEKKENIHQKHLSHTAVTEHHHYTIIISTT